MPQVACDPVVAAPAIVMALQTIVSRNVPPLEMAIVTVGAFHAGSAPNVIPQSAELKLTVRALKREVRLQLKQRITEICQAQAAVFGARVEFDFQWRYPVLVNDAESTAFARQVAADWVGEAGLMPPLQPLTGSEDFAFLLKSAKAAICCWATAWARAGAKAAAWRTTPAMTSTTAAWAPGPATCCVPA